MPPGPSNPGAANTLMRNTGLMLAGRFFSIFSNLAFLTLTARLFSLREVAVLALLASLNALMDVTKGIGLGPHVVKQIPRAKRCEVATLVVSYLTYSLIPVGAVAAVGLLLSERLAVLFFATPAYGGWLAAGIGSSFFVCLTNSNLFLLQAKARFGSVTALSFLTHFLQKLAPCLAVAVWGGGFGMFLAMSLAASAAAWVFTLMPLLKWLFEAGRSWMRLGTVWRECRQYYFSGLLRYGATQLDPLLVAILFDSTALAVYFILRRLYSTGVVLIDSFADALVPDLARQLTRDEGVARRTLAFWNRRSLLIAALFAAVMVANGQQALGLVFGRTYTASPMLVLLFCLATVTYLQLSFTQIESLLFESPRVNLRITLATAAGNALAGLILAIWFGPAGLVGGLLCGHIAGVTAGNRGRSWSGVRPVPTAGALAGICLIAGLAAELPFLRVPDWAGALVVNGVLVAVGWRLAGGAGEVAEL